MKKVISVMLVIISLCILLVSCGGKKNGLTGTWTPRDYDFGEDYVLIFNEDGTGTYFGEAITYKTEGDKLSIWFEGTDSLDTTFHLDGDEMWFKDSNGEDVFWVRK